MINFNSHINFVENIFFERIESCSLEKFMFSLSFLHNVMLCYVAFMLKFTHCSSLIYTQRAQSADWNKNINLTIERE